MFLKLFSVFVKSTDNFAFIIIKKTEVIRHKLLQVICNICILGVKKSCSCLSMYFSWTFTSFSYLLMTPKIVCPALPSLPHSDSDMNLSTCPIYLDGHRHLVHTISALNDFSSKFPISMEPPSPQASRVRTSRKPRLLVSPLLPIPN